jgi:hypothetical protein
MEKKKAQRITQQLRDELISPAEAEAAQTAAAELREQIDEMKAAGSADRAEFIKHKIREVIKQYNAFYQSPERDALCELFPDFDEWFNDAELLDNDPAHALLFLVLFDAVKPILPEIISELRAIKGKPGMQDLTFDELMQEGKKKKDGSRTPSLFMQIVEQINERSEGEQTEAVARIMDTLPKLESIRVHHYISPNNKLANLMTKGIINQPEFDLETIHSKNGKAAILSSVIVSLEGSDLTFTGREYTQYDRAIHDIIVSIWREEKEKGKDPIYITPLKIYHTMKNYTSLGKSPSAKSIQSITKSIEKMRRIHVKVDATAEAQKRKLKDDDGRPVDSFTFGEYLLTLRDVEITSGGKSVKGYMLLSEPVLHYYSRMIGNQLLSAPLACLTITDGNGVIIADTESRISIKTYLLQRMAQMKNDERKAADALRKYNASRHFDSSLPEKPLASFRTDSRIILFDTLFKEAGQDSSNREVQRRNREYTFAVLDSWKRGGQIADYHEQRKGKQITGIVIVI